MVSAFARVVQRRMSAFLRPLPVRSGMLDICRDWRSWLEPLDDIPKRDGIVGLKTANVHWLCFTRRCDLPLDVAAVTELPASGGVSPNDVMLMCKEYMSSANLMQAPCVFLNSGASNVMPNPTCPPAWETRIPFSQEAKHDAERLWTKVHRLLPQRSRAVEYMKEWMARPGLPAGQPSTPLILDRRYHLDTLGEPIGVVLERAIMHGSTGEPKLLRVKRRKPGLKIPCEEMPLASWIRFREGQGIGVLEAAQEWNGAQQLRAAAAPPE